MFLDHHGQILEPASVHSNSHESEARMIVPALPPLASTTIATDTMATGGAMTDTNPIGSVLAKPPRQKTAHPTRPPSHSAMYIQEPKASDSVHAAAMLRGHATTSAISLAQLGNRIRRMNREASAGNL
jgi:hypothetical protein